MTNQDQSGGRDALSRALSRVHPSIRPRNARSAGPTASTDPSWVWTATAIKASTRRQDQAPDPVLAEAFGRPYAGGDSLQRHPADAGALDAERDGQDADEPADPVARSRRRRGAGHACGTCARACAVEHPDGQARRARRALRRQGVLRRAGGSRHRRAGHRHRRRLGGPQDRRGRRGVHHVEGDAGNQRHRAAARGQIRQSRCGGCRFGGHRGSGQRPGGLAGLRRRASTGAATSSPTTT